MVYSDRSEFVFFVFICCFWNYSAAERNCEYLCPSKLLFLVLGFLLYAIWPDSRQSIVSGDQPWKKLGEGKNTQDNRPNASKSLDRLVSGFCHSLKKLQLKRIEESSEEIRQPHPATSLTGSQELRIQGFLWSSCLRDRQTRDLYPSFSLVISSLVSLRSLSLWSCNITAEEVITLAPIISRFVILELIDLCGNIFGGRDGIASLSTVFPQLPNLLSLNRNGCNLDNSDFLSLASCLTFLPRVTDLDLSDNLHKRNGEDEEEADGIEFFKGELPWCSLLHSLSLERTGWIQLLFADSFSHSRFFHRSASSIFPPWALTIVPSAPFWMSFLVCLPHWKTLRFPSNTSTVVFGRLSP